eukprot:TRINITY_DN58824_c0_g1_i1.p1 TRINITY_DN58824_c0_g1~~TRINITY_DN58824_c0_g1_i1.p1  ORF type:complete len:107 (+),score=33.59 TRINITY_DN58824_c0_g1_i1:159-479(+)
MCIRDSKRKEAAQKRKDFQNRRENDISMALGSSRATPKSAQKRSGSPKSMTSGADGSSSLDGSYSNVPVSVMLALSLIHISEPTRLLSISYAVFCLKKKKNTHTYL